MHQTKLMRADEIAHSFNGVTERQYWRAVVAGTRLNPEVHFNSRASMVCVAYSISTGGFSVSFSKTAAAFGDYLASAYRSLEQITAALKAAGLPFATLLDGSGVLRLEYEPDAKVVVIHMARHGDLWADAEPLPFKVPERNSSENSQSALDPPSTGE